MPPIDLEPAAEAVAAVVRRIGDDGLGRWTPCQAWTVRDLANHVAGMAVAYRAAALRMPGPPPTGSGSGGRPAWRGGLARDLAGLAVAWSPARTWVGDTAIGRVTVPAEVAGLIALNELLVHGWDLARATGQPFAPEPALVAAALRFVTPLAMMDPDGRGAFAAPVALPEEAGDLDRLLAHNGRSPAWSPAPGGPGRDLQIDRWVPDVRVVYRT